MVLKFRRSTKIWNKIFFFYLGRKIVDLKFVVREDTDSLVVAANGESGSIIEIWELREKPLTIHKIFQPKHAAPAEPLKTVVSKIF